MSRTILFLLSCAMVCCSVTSMYIDCWRQCYYDPHSRYCACRPPRMPLRWGKRGGVRVPFRWGKRSVDVEQNGSYGDSWYDSSPLDFAAYFQD